MSSTDTNPNPEIEPNVNEAAILANLARVFTECAILGHRCQRLEEGTVTAAHDLGVTPDDVRIKLCRYMEAKAGCIPPDTDIL